jgi:carbon storage regulator CsrA
MLILSRRRREKILILVGGVTVGVEIVHVDRGSVGVEIKAPRQIGVLRTQVYEARRQLSAGGSKK